ncbi:hypothetical protein GPECTOR_724g881 [Gonium pectorale]|uniref:Uncharacterized protein n=1 Tax=Gonium pectorale TaxID=33097 RepID=A0A150FVC6_GONPE|nr:hypothetical protein GPECTOR_724g881 [Gonium pectorale]|eukprot:KXZ41145.1 hypothetical protein GPECTOR_724g881 [Gonium pectorale]
MHRCKQQLRPKDCRLPPPLQLKDIQYECAACFVDTEPSETGSCSAVMLRRKAAAKLVCEHPDGPHPVEGTPGHDIPADAPEASWLRTHARGLRPLMRALELMWRHGPQEAQGPAGGSGEAGQQAAILQSVIKRLEQEESEAHASSCQPGSSSLPEGGGDKPGELDPYVSCQEARSSIEKLLEEGERKVDGGRSKGPLRRVVSRSGAVMWLCPCHADKHVW